MKNIFIFLLISLSMKAQQEQLPFYEIGEYPSEYSSTNIVSRMIEGLGYRFYWATESLEEKDLNYKPSQDSRSTFEVIEHIYGLSLAIVLTMDGKEFDFSQDKLDYQGLREKTLKNLEYVFNSLKEIEDLSTLTITLNQGGNKMAIWHCGQVVTNRRASGNPINSKVNVFVGKTI